MFVSKSVFAVGCTTKRGYEVHAFVYKFRLEEAGLRVTTSNFAPEDLGPSERLRFVGVIRAASQYFVEPGHTSLANC